MKTWIEDARYGIRLLARTPTFTAAAVVTLALPIAASAGIFSRISMLVLRPLPIRNPERVVFMPSVDPKTRSNRAPVSIPDFADWRGRATSFEDVAALSFGTHNLTWAGDPLRVSAIRVTTGLFRVWGIEPLFGRRFRPEEERPGAEPVVLLGHGFWVRRFASDPAVLGRSIVLDGRPHQIVGVLGPALEREPFRGDVWTCLTIDAARSDRSNRWLEVTSRLRASAGVEQARREMAMIARQLEREHPVTNAGWGVRVIPTSEQLVSASGRTVLGLLVAVVVFLLAIACTNVANLVLARNNARFREFAIRSALGARRPRLIRQLVVENLVLSFAGAAVGLVLAAWGLDVLRTSTSNPVFDELTVDRHVLGLTLALAFAAPLLFGLVPAVQSTRVDLVESLKEGARALAGGRSATGRRIIAGSQMALALMAATLATLVARSAIAISRIETGFDPENLLTFRLELAPLRYSPEQAAAFFETAIQRIRTIPGVRAAGAVNVLPVADRERMVPLEVQGHAASNDRDPPWAAVASVTTGYFVTAGIPLLGGRYLTEADAAVSRPVAVVSQELVRRYWPARDPLGRRLRTARPGRAGPWLEVVGVVRDVRNSDVDAQLLPQVYLPHRLDPDRAMALVVRAHTDRTALAAPIRRAVREVDAELPIYDVRTMRQVIRDDLEDTYLLATLFAIFSLVALALAAAGVHGVTSYSVSRRTHEFGVRAALGAPGRELVRMVVLEQALAIGPGIGLGLAGAAGLARLLSGLLYGVRPTDPATFAVNAVVLAAVALAASYLPARRAARVDPLAALRQE